MSDTFFLGGSRSIQRLPQGFKNAIDDFLVGDVGIVVGDAPGADYEEGE